jgi:hypothetical protein
MKTALQGIVGAVALFVATVAQGQTLSIPTGQSPLDPSAVPKFGNFYFLVNPSLGYFYPPLPGPPGDTDAPIYALGNGDFLIDNSGVSAAGATSGMALSLSRFSTMDEPVPGSSGGSQGPCPGFSQQVFSVVDTNAVAANDTNLYNELLRFPADTNTGPDLQIMLYHTNIVLVRASHFDYSADTRDFALVVCDSVALPLWKNINLSDTTNAQDGWLIQGLVPNWQVADPMYLMISNVSLSCDAFFQAIPYSGPQITLSGANSGDTVSNIITLQATIADLSGTTGQEFEMDVDGLPARCTLGPSNTFAIDTRYAPSGSADVSLSVANTDALIYDWQNPVFDTKLTYQTSADLPLDFSNPTYVEFSGDMCSPDVGTNYILFVVSEPQNIQAAISDPSNGHVVARYSGYVPYPATVEIPWNFTEGDGVTPYSNDTYVVAFEASDPTDLSLTNTIARTGVRAAAGCAVTYETEDPSTPTGAYLDSQASNVLGDLAYMYTSLYDTDFASLTQYGEYQIGPNRDNPSYPVMPFVLSKGTEGSWLLDLTNCLGNVGFSDFDYGQGHGNGSGLGGGPAGSTWVRGFVDTFSVQHWVLNCESPNWRMRKVALWACYTGSSTLPSAGGSYSTWPAAFGISPTSVQMRSWMGKNVGLFFLGELPQGGFGGSQNATSAQVATDFDILWVQGPSPYPGGCDPTYAFGWAAQQIVGAYPEVLEGKPIGIGYLYLPYTGIYDTGEILTNNPVDIKTN